MQKTKGVDIARINTDDSVSRTTIKNPKNLVLLCYYIADVQVAWSHIIKTFGPPTINGDHDKYDAMWIMETPSGLAMVHNYKDGHGFLGAAGKDTKDITDWVIRGENCNATLWIKRALIYKIKS